MSQRPPRRVSPQALRHLAGEEIGGLVAPETYDSGTWKILNDHQLTFDRLAKDMYTEDLTRDEELIDVEIHIANSEVLDAYCTAFQPGEHLIVLRYGFFANLLATMMGIMSHPGVLPEVGDPSLDDPPDFDPRDGDETLHHLFLDGLMELAYENDRRVLPVAAYSNDDVRRTYAFVLANLAYEFAVHHELSHIFLGHTNYFARTGRSFALHQGWPDEEVLRALPSVSSLSRESLYQALEYDADQNAIQAVVHYLWNEPRRSLLGDYGEFFGDEADLLLALSIALRVLFHLLDEAAPPSPYYPRFDIRLFSTYSAALVTLGFVDGEEAQMHWAACFAAGKREYFRLCEALSVAPRYQSRRLEVTHHLPEKRLIEELDRARLILYKELLPYRYNEVTTSSD